MAPAAAAAAGETFLDRPGPYVVLTTDGFRIDAMAAPEKDGDKVRIRLAPNGQLTILPASRIDWPATERFNAPRPAPEAGSGREPAAGGSLSLTAVAGRSPGEPVEMTIIGSKSSMHGSDDSEPAGEPSAEARGGSTVKPAVPTDPAEVAAQLSELRRQMAALKDDYQQSVKNRDELQARKAELEQKVAKEPRTSPDQDYQSPSRKALAQVEERLSGLSQTISTLERRMNDLRFRAVELGGTLD